MTNLPESAYDEFCNDLFIELEKLHNKTLGGIMDQLATLDKSKAPSTFMGDANKILEPKWSTLEGRLSVANGKDILSLINGWIKTKYHKSSSRTRLISSLKPDDISQEVTDLINMLIN